MHFDFLVVTSWKDVDVERTGRWADSLAQRGYDVCFLRPSTRASYRTGDGVHTVSMESLVSTVTSTLRVENIESRFDIPSLAHLAFTERLYFGLSHQEAIERGRKLATAFASFFENHSVDNTLQIRGAELHRLLLHYLTEHYGGTSIWAGFSPFDDTFALQSDLKGSWDTYETVPYAEIPESDRMDVREHIDEFTREQKRYTYTTDVDRDQSLLRYLASVASDVWEFAHRDAPGARRDQLASAARYWIQERVNERLLLPDSEESSRQLESAEYVFFPLQYPVESRLTVFSPQFYHQEHVVEYVARTLPGNLKLFVKPHPNHRELPDPDTLVRFNRHPRIEVLHPELNAHEVVRNSQAVVVTNNTVGFETLYHRKPLVVLGNGFYDGTTAVTKVRDMSSVPDVLGDVVGETVPEEQTVESIYSLQQAAYPGVRSSVEAADVEQVVDSAIDYISDIRRDQNSEYHT